MLYVHRDSADCVTYKYFQKPLNLDGKIQSDVMTIPICVFGGDETKENIEMNLAHYENEITVIKEHNGVVIGGQHIPVGWLLIP